MIPSTPRQALTFAHMLVSAEMLRGSWSPTPSLSCWRFIETATPSPACATRAARTLQRLGTALTVTLDTSRHVTSLQSPHFIVQLRGVAQLQQCCSHTDAQWRRKAQQHLLHSSFIVLRLSVTSPGAVNFSAYQQSPSRCVCTTQTHNSRFLVY